MSETDWYVLHVQAINEDKHFQVFIVTLCYDLFINLLTRSLSNKNVWKIKFWKIKLTET